MTAYLSGDGSLSALLQLKVDAAYVPSKSISQLIHFKNGRVGFASTVLPARNSRVRFVTSLGIGIYGAGESNRRKQGPELRLSRSIRTEQSTEKYREGPRATRASPLDSELGSEIARSI